MPTHTAESTEPLSAEELARAQALLAEFKSNQPQYSFLELLESYPDDSYRLAAKACNLFDVELVLYRPVTGLHGVTAGNCILLAGYGYNTGDRRPFCVAGHEVSHMLGQRRSAEHAELTSYIMRECVVDDAFYRRSQIEKLNQGILGLLGERPVPDDWDATVKEEIIADIAGELWQDPVFWAGIHSGDVSADRRAVYSEIMTRLEKEKPSPYRPWTSDVVKVRERYVDYVLGFLE